MTSDASSFAHLTLSIIVVAPLTYAGVAKLLDPERFATVLPAFALGLPVRPLTATVLGASELAIALGALLLSSWPAACAVALAYMGFAVVLERARRRGASGDCGCFGALRTTISGGAVGRNVLLAILAAVLVFVRATTALSRYELGAALGMSVALGLGTAALDTALSVRAARR